MDAPHLADAPEEATPPVVAAEARTSATSSRRTLGLILLATLAAFWPTLASFPPTWNASYQEHGFFVGALVLWLLWRDRRRVVEAAGDAIPDLIPVIGLLSLGWLFATVMNVRLVYQLLFWFIVTLSALAIFGWRARTPILATAATFLLAIPFWGALRPILQRATTVASGGIATLAGIDAEIGYDTITISAGTFLVQEGCSGINYLMGGLVLGAFYAHLFTERWQTKLKIVALAGAMSIVGNWIRVAVLVFLGEATAMQSPHIQDHLWQGWAIFTVLMIPTYFLARRIEERDAMVVPRPGEEVDATGPSRGEAPYDAQAADSRAEPVVPDAALRRRAVHVCAVAVLGPMLFFILGGIPRGDELDRDPGILSLGDGWTVQASAASDGVWTPSFSGFDERAHWVLTGGSQPIHAARYYFMDQRQGEELIQYDNQIAPDSLVAADRIVGPVGPERRLIHEAVIRDEETPRVVWYWYRVGGLDTPFEIRAKLLEILAFFRRTPAAELVVLDAECTPGDCTDAAMALRSAMGVSPEPE